MAATDNGIAHLYGITGTVSNATVQDLKLDDAFANVDKTEDEVGNVIERRSDDLTTNGTLTLKIKSTYTIPSVGDTITFNTVKYEITKIGKTQKNKGFRMIELSFVTSANVTLT